MRNGGPWPASSDQSRVRSVNINAIVCESAHRESLLCYALSTHGMARSTGEVRLSPELEGISCLTVAAAQAIIHHWLRKSPGQATLCQLFVFGQQGIGIKGPATVVVEE